VNTNNDSIELDQVEVDEGEWEVTAGPDDYAGGEELLQQDAGASMMGTTAEPVEAVVMVRVLELTKGQVEIEIADHTEEPDSEDEDQHSPHGYTLAFLSEQLSRYTRVSRTITPVDDLPYVCVIIFWVYEHFEGRLEMSVKAGPTFDSHGERAVLHSCHGVHRVDQRHPPPFGCQLADLTGEPVVRMYKAVPTRLAGCLGAQDSGCERAHLSW
jgi:hypothetical protein